MNEAASPRVRLLEVGPRDGFQSLRDVLSTDEKMRVVERLVEAGAREIQVTSFVNPARVPQFADAEALCARLGILPPARPQLTALALNARGVERAVAARLDGVDISMSCSESHSRRNVGRGLVEALADMRTMAHAARAGGLGLRVGLQCAFGCATEGAIAPGRVSELAAALVEGTTVDAPHAGDARRRPPDRLSLADSTGQATPELLREVLARVRDAVPGIPLVLHLHDTYGRGMANFLAGLEAGVTHFDTALGGLGGCPFIPGAAGNLATEDVAALCEDMGLSTGLDVDALARESRRLETLLGVTLPGKMHRVLAARTRTP